MNPLPDDASKDQYGEIPQGYYRRNTGMLHMLPTAPQSPANAPLSGEQLAKLEDMSKESLINLIRSVSSAIWGYALMDDSQKSEAARLKLYSLGMDSSEVHKVVPALDKWFDRTVGRAKQQIEITGKDGAPLSVRLIEAQQRLLKDITPQNNSIGHSHPIAIEGAI